MSDFKVEGMHELEVAINKLSKPDTIKMLKEIADVVVMPSLIENFQAMQSPAGAKWDFLKKSTVKRKGSSRILFDTGALIQSIQVLEVTADHALVGVVGQDEKRTKKALSHQLGSETSHIPARPYIGVKPRDREQALEIAAKYIHW